MSQPGQPENPLPPPPGPVCIPWIIAYDIETLLRRAGFEFQADKLRAYIAAAEQAGGRP